MNEDKLKKLSEQIPVPDKLKPENVEKMIQEHTIPVNRMARRIALTAASFLLLLSVGNYLFSSGILTFHSDLCPGESSPLSDCVEENTSGNSSLTYEDARKTISYYLDHTAYSAGLGFLDDDINYEYAEAENDGEEFYGGSSSVKKSKSMPENSSSEEYSDTNLQVEGVDEGDIVKTDGSYIYVCSESSFGSTIRIYKADGKQTEKVSTFTTQYVSVYEMYLHDDTLVLVGTNLDTPGDPGFRTKIDSFGYTTPESMTTILLYNIADPSNPDLFFNESQSGNYSNSRMNGKYLYTFSTMYVHSATEEDEPELYIPSVGDSLVPEESLYCPKYVYSNSYVVLTSLDVTVTEGKEFQDTLSVLGESDTLYASENNIYLATPTYDDSSKTTISKFHYDNGELKFQCDTTFKGTILNQFSMDEYNGNLRFVATTYKRSGSTSNGLYVLDENLKLIGSVDNLAKSERIYSARFLGDKAYFVTYRETDPVFMVDVSVPENPVVKDELKLPGFSEYLHPFGDNLLLGIGCNEEKGDTQVKLSMFDISQDSSIKEKHTKLLAEGTESIAGENHKAVLISQEKNLIGFSTEAYYSDDEDDVSYQIYSYDPQKGFQKVATLSPKDLELETARGLYIGDYLYLVDGDGMCGMCIYDMETMKKVQTIKE